MAIPIPEDPMIAINTTNRLAFVLDGKVVHVQNCSARNAAIMTSNPIVIDITEHERGAFIQVGLDYDEETGAFASEYR
jgi:hypothetical protein